MWVADMDFESPACIKSALRKYVDNGIFGYHSEPKGLREILKKYLDSWGIIFIFLDDIAIMYYYFSVFLLWLEQLMGYQHRPHLEQELVKV